MHDSSILIRNIFHMLCYAFHVLRQQNYADIETEWTVADNNIVEIGSGWDYARPYIYPASAGHTTITATSVTSDGFTADVMAETLRRSSLGKLSPGSYVNLERAMAANGRFGGHIVSGHIDGTGTIRSFEKEDNAIWVTIEADKNILRFIVEKGSITIDGISLTVAYVDNECFKVSIIPHTSSETTLTDKKVKDIVNLENDIVGKYVEKLLGIDSGVKKVDDKKSSGTLNMDILTRNGFL